jgi:CelD/BcsL family acetyltransferase involved in cellulose biosynthesis
MRVELTDDPSAFVGRDWNGLVAADPAGTFFHTPAYLKLWWEEFGTGRLVLAFAEDGGRTVGAGAFEVTGRVLTFLGGFDVTDYMGPVSLPGLESAVAAEMIAALRVESGWGRADLRGLPGDSRWLGALEAAVVTQGLRADRAEDGLAPMLELPRRFEDYLAALPGKLRHEIRRKERRLAGEAGPYRVRAATSASVRADMDRFIELHRASPGPKGEFMDAAMEIYFRRLADVFLPAHMFHLVTMEVDEEHVAAAIGFAYGDTFSLYNSTFDRRFERWSPGMVLVPALIEHAIEGGRERFDMLKGDLEYKYRFGAKARRVMRLMVER